MSNKRKQEDIGYESPQMQTIKLESEQVLAGSTMLDDMTETGGAWEMI